MGAPGPQKINRHGIAFKLKAVDMSNQPGPDQGCWRVNTAKHNSLPADNITEVSVLDPCFYRFSNTNSSDDARSLASKQEPQVNS